MSKTVAQPVRVGSYNSHRNTQVLPQPHLRVLGAANQMQLIRLHGNNRCESLSRILVPRSTVTCLPLVLVLYLLACTRLLLHFQIQKHHYYITAAINYLPIKLITNVRQDLASVAMALFGFVFVFLSKHIFLSFFCFLLYFFKQSHINT